MHTKYETHKIVIIKKAPIGAFFKRLKSTLTCFKTWIGLINDINTTLTANHAVVAVTRHKRFKRIFNFHFNHLYTLIGVILN